MELVIGGCVYRRVNATSIILSAIFFPFFFSSSFSIGSSPPSSDRRCQAIVTKIAEGVPLPLFRHLPYQRPNHDKPKFPYAALSMWQLPL